MTITDEEHDFLNFIEEEYLMKGTVPSEADCAERRIVSGIFYKKCFKNADFRHALLVRGITLRGLDVNSATASRLTEKQLTTANMLLDRMGDTRSDKKKLADLGVSGTEYAAWLRDPVYQNYLRTRAEALLGDNLHEGHLALIDRVKSGDVGAIKYFNELTGRYNPNAKDNVDVNAVVMMIIEVIQRHVLDPTTLNKIAEDIALVAGGVVAATGDRYKETVRDTHKAPVGGFASPKEIMSNLDKKGVIEL